MASVKRLALIGNQNSGKTTLFNALTGSNQYVGNWPGVTVDRVSGTVKGKGWEITDLPGLYSLSPYSPEELVSRDFLLGDEYDVVINVVDASHLERSLSLTAEVLAYKKPMVVALNMMDLAAHLNIQIDVKALERKLGVKVIPISAASGAGIEDLLSAIEATDAASAPATQVFPDDLQQAIAAVGAKLPSNLQAGDRQFIAAALLQRDRVYVSQYQNDDALQVLLTKERADLEEKYGTDVETLIATKRYDFVDDIVKDAVKKGVRASNKLTHAIDQVVTNRFLAIPIFAAIVYIIYYIAVSTVGTMGTDYANDVLFGEYATDGANALLDAANSPDWLRSLVVDGIIGGVGAVLGFVPQMVVLFLMLAFLEQCGYMSRVAFVLDRIFRHFGLSGLCFIPMVVATGCGVPALMSTKSIENINERRITLITTTFMPCSAKLPIIAMISAAFFPESTWIAPAVYLLAIMAVVVSAIILKKGDAFKEEVSPFVMELPDYHLPTLFNIFRSVYERCRAFVIKAGTIIFSVVVVVWFLSSFNFTAEGFGMVDVNDSMLAAIGSVIAFIFAPLGFGTWQSAVAIFTGLLAKENVVGTLAALLNLADAAEDDPSLGAALHGMFTTNSAALAFLCFNLFSTPCVAALGAMKRGLFGGKMFAFGACYMIVYAYVLSMIIYHLGGLIVGEVPFGIGTVVAAVLLIAVLYLLFRPDRARKTSIKIASKAV